MFKKVGNFFRRQSSARYIALGFLLTILLGSGLLMIPACWKDGVRLAYVDSLFTSTSAICVTGLATVDLFDTFTPLGQVIIFFLLQIGGLGVTTLGAAVILAFRRNINLKERNIIQDSLNTDSARGLLKLFKRVFIYTIVIELVGAALSLISFARTYPIGEAIWKSAFHSVASFNNAGFDILGGFQNLQNYKGDVLLNIVTMLLIVLGGLGFLVMSDVVNKRGNFKKLTVHSKVVLLMTGVLIVLGMFLLKLTEMNNISWLGALFTSVSSRTAGFATFDIGKFTKPGLLVLIVLMFIGASPGSTGGGIKTTSFFLMLVGTRSMISHHTPHAFKYSFSEESVKRAMVISLLALTTILLGSFAMSMIEPDIHFIDILFENTSAFGTVGLSTGITPNLSIGSKIISCLQMYVGRIGPLTFVSTWYTGNDEYFKYSEGVIPVG
ncbi:MAG: H(+)-transporting ATPase [Bacilli bacterium]|nr:H(+)-transporting ATPase [Bacilli bacterium]